MNLRCSTLALSLCLAAPAWAADVKVDGSDVTYADKAQVEGVEARLTGTGLRKKFFFNVYTIASYVAADAKASTPAELAALDVPKRLHIIMERGVDGKTMGDAFREAIANNHDIAKMKGAVDALSKYLEAGEAKEKHAITFDHVPGKGVRVGRTGSKPVLIEGMGFARAVWDIYLGKKNVSDDIRKGLVARL